LSWNLGDFLGKHADFADSLKASTNLDPYLSA